MRHNLTFFVVVATTALGCGASSSQPRAAAGDVPAAHSSAAGPAEALPSGGPLRFDAVTPRAVTTVDFHGGRLGIGFSDGAVALVDVAAGKVTHSKVAKVFSVAAVSPNGQLALLDASPPVIVNMNGDLVLQMNTVPTFESAVFGNDNITLYVADKEGKVRIWGQPHSFEEDQHKEKLEDYLNRQAPDFHVEFPPIRGPIHITDTNKLVVVDQEGAVRLWDPTRPSGSKRIMKVGGGARSIGSSGGHIFVTSVTGALKVGLEDGSGFLPWSKDAEARFVAAGPSAGDSFFTLDDGMLRRRTIESGAQEWAVEVPAGYACGLALADDGNTLAACINNFIAAFDARTGRPVAYGYRAEGDFVWKR